MPDPNDPNAIAQQAMANGQAVAQGVGTIGGAYGGNLSPAAGTVQPHTPRNTDINNRDAGFELPYQQVKDLYTDQNAAANNAAIQAGYGQTLSGYGHGGSSLAGITHLGATTQMNAAGIDQANSNNLLHGQLQDINALNMQAQGQGPSVAAEQAKQQSEANIAAQMGVIGSQRGGGNSALGLRQAQDQAAQSQQQAVQAGVMGRTQEEMAARQQLTGALQGTQAQAMQGAQAQAGMQQQANQQNAGAMNQANLQQGQMNQDVQLGNLQAQLQAGQIDINQYNNMLQAQLAQSNNQLTANMNFGGTLVNENTQLQGLQAGQAINSANNSMGLVGAGIGGLSTVGAGVLSAPKGSDRRLKTNVRPGDRSVKAFLASIAEAPSSGFARLEAI